MKAIIKWTSDYDRWNGFNNGDIIDVEWSETKHAYLEINTKREFVKKQMILIEEKKGLFNKGDVVELDKKSKFCNKEGSCNPVKTKGEIININFYSQHPFFVRWENGEFNSYNYEDLKLIAKTMKTREKEFNRKAYLLERAKALLDAARDMQDRVDTKLQYNTEVAEPNDFTPWSDEEIDTSVRGRDRLYYAFEKVLMEILNNEA